MIEKLIVYLSDLSHGDRRTFNGCYGEIKPIPVAPQMGPNALERQRAKRDEVCNYDFSSLR